MLSLQSMIIHHFQTIAANNVSFSMVENSSTTAHEGSWLLIGIVFMASPICCREMGYLLVHSLRGDMALLIFSKPLTTILLEVFKYIYLGELASQNAMN